MRPSASNQSTKYLLSMILNLASRVLTLSLSDTDVGRVVLSLGCCTGGGGALPCVSPLVFLLPLSGPISDASLALDPVVSLGDGAVLGGEGVARVSCTVMSDKSAAEGGLLLVERVSESEVAAGRKGLRLGNKLLKNVLNNTLRGKR